MPTIRPSFEALPLVRRVLESEAGCGFKLSYYPGDHDWALHPTKDGAGIMSVSQRNGIIRLNGYFLYEADNVMEFQCPEELMIAMDDYFEKLDESSIRERVRSVFPSIIQEMEAFERMLAQVNTRYGAEVQTEPGGDKWPWAEIPVARVTEEWTSRNTLAIIQLTDRFEKWLSQRRRREDRKEQHFDRRYAQIECQRVVQIFHDEGIECESSVGRWLAIADPTVVWVVSPTIKLEGRAGPQSFISSAFRYNGEINVRSPWLFDIFREADKLYPAVLESLDPIQALQDGMRFSDKSVRTKYEGRLPYVVRFYEKLEELVQWSNARNSGSLELNYDQGVLDVRARLRGRTDRLPLVKRNIRAIGDVVKELEKWVPANRPDGHAFEFRRW